MSGSRVGRKLLSYAVTAAVIAVIALPFASAYAASSAYSFSMLLRVDGCGNGEMHPLDAGTAKLTGSTSTPASSGISINYTLYRDVFGPNPSFGTVTRSPNTSFSNAAFSKAITTTGTNYCLDIWRGSSDGITVSGSGTLHN